MNRNYELVVILNPDLTAKEQEELLSKIKKLVTNAKAKAVDVKELGRKELAYRISKKSAGVFYVISFSVPPAFIPSLKQKLQLEEKILRYLLVIKKVSSAKASKAGADQRR